MLALNDLFPIFKNKLFERNLILALGLHFGPLLVFPQNEDAPTQFAKKPAIEVALTEVTNIIFDYFLDPVFK